MLEQPLGPVMVDVAGLALTNDDRERLRHPLVGAVILFARNYQSRHQVIQLIAQIKALRSPSLLVAVDQEGGRVQRFQHEFTRLPAANTFGEHWDDEPERAKSMARQSANTMASELIEVGVDFSFAPVFDVTTKLSDVIGDRCFHTDPIAATALLNAYIAGMHEAGMVAIAKHFPGHGGVAGDSHHCLPQDARCLADVEQHDLKPYVALTNDIQGVMTAHVLFEECDSNIPTYSRFWLQEVLRKRLGFRGIVFSDDLSMQGAIDANEDKASIISSAERAIEAGCDMVLVCNRPDLVDELLTGLSITINQELSNRLLNLKASKI